MKPGQASRRDLLKGGGLAALSAGLAGTALAQDTPPVAGSPADPVTADTLRCAEALYDVRYTEAERAQAVLEIEDWIDRTARLRWVDAVRAASLLVVVLGHYLIAVVVLRDDDVTVSALLDIAPWTHPVTWAVQVMACFFAVGAVVADGVADSQ